MYYLKKYIMKLQLKNTPLVNKIEDSIFIYYMYIAYITFIALLKLYYVINSFQT